MTPNTPPEPNRNDLPFRKNCEGYFVDREGNILAREEDDETIIFPGGGIDDSEPIKAGMRRETMEETGAMIQDLTSLGTRQFIWGKDWPKTKKQQERYQHYQGDEMYFFRGIVGGFEEQRNVSEDYWLGSKWMPLRKVISGLKAKLNSDRNNVPYRQCQFQYLLVIAKWLKLNP